MESLEGLKYEFAQALLSVDRLAAQHMLIDPGSSLSPVQLAETMIVPALEWIGAEWERGRVALAQVYMSGRICEHLVDTILPPGSPNRKGQPRMAVAVLQDYHLLGKRIVCSVLRAGGFDLLDYGQVEADELVSLAMADDIEVLLISTLMLPSALRIRDVRAKLKESGSDIKIVVGGAPFRFDDQLWREVGADAMGRSASEAMGIITRIAGGTS